MFFHDSCCRLLDSHLFWSKEQTHKGTPEFVYNISEVEEIIILKVSNWFMLLMVDLLHFPVSSSLPTHKNNEKKKE